MGVSPALLTKNMADIDQRIRLTAFSRLDEQVGFHGGELRTAFLPFDDINEKLMRFFIAPDPGC
jgi:hypothetical protein